jgi:hypothetical protein
VADAYKTLIQAVITASAATLGAAVPGGKSWIVKHIAVVNVTSGAITFQLFRNGTASTNAWTQAAISVPANGMAEWDGTEAMAAAETLAGVASLTNSLYLTASGDEIT